MANITSYVSQILSAIYGREVRSSIANALTAMNNEINVDLSAVQASTNQAKLYADSASLSSTQASLSSTQANNAKESALQSSEQATVDRSEANKARILAEHAASIAQDLLSYANYEKVYDFFRSKIIQQEGYEVTRSIEDSDGNAILDSEGNPILGRYLLDPLKFADILEYVELNIDLDDIYLYVLEHLNANDSFWSAIFDYVFEHLNLDETFWTNVMERILRQTNVSKIFEKIFVLLLKEENVQAIFDMVYPIIRHKIIQQEGYEVTRSIEDSDGNAILDSEGNPILGRYLLDPLKFADILEYVEGAA